MCLNCITMASQVSDKQAVYVSGALAAVLILLPFHAFFTTWIGSNTGHLDAVRIWKEVIIVALIPSVFLLLLKDKYLKGWFIQSWLVRFIGLYAALHIVLGLAALHSERVNGTALIYSLLANLRFFGLFLMTLVASYQSDFLRRNWKTIVIVPAGLVIAFGLMQRFVLPFDFLKHFGYGPKTIPAYQTVDQKLSYVRVQSTLRGANPLGAYLVLAIPIFLTIKRRKLGLSMLAAGIIALLFTYSRAAWIGAVLALFTYAYTSVSSVKIRRRLVVISVLLATLAGLSVVMLRQNSVIQNAFFHTDNFSKSSESSNTSRARALGAGLRDVVHEPFGRGPGTAGPASLRNNHASRVAENYYLQIGQEVGWLGLGLFFAINVMVGYGLWRSRADNLSRVLLAALAGISFINLLSHAWADDTLGLLWWGLAGIAYSSVILKSKQKYNEIPAKKKTTARS